MRKITEVIQDAMPKRDILSYGFRCSYSWMTKCQYSVSPKWISLRCNDRPPATVNRITSEQVLRNFRLIFDQALSKVKLHEIRVINLLMQILTRFDIKCKWKSFIKWMFKNCGYLLNVLYFFSMESLAGHLSLNHCFRA